MESLGQTHVPVMLWHVLDDEKDEQSLSLEQIRRDCVSVAVGEGVWVGMGVGVTVQVDVRVDERVGGRVRVDEADEECVPLRLREREVALVDGVLLRDEEVDGVGERVRVAVLEEEGVADKVRENDDDHEWETEEEAEGVMDERDDV